ncbi:hypothetical protein FRC01_007026, partial [Tulasnella sp. 417]
IAESTPGLWTFIILSNKAISQDAMKRRLELSGNLPLNVSMRLLRKEPDNEYMAYLGHNVSNSNDQSFCQMHALLVDQVSRWKTLRVEATVEVPSKIRQWIPSELPNV